MEKKKPTTRHVRQHVMQSRDGIPELLSTDAAKEKGEKKNWGRGKTDELKPLLIGADLETGSHDEGGGNIPLAYLSRPCRGVGIQGIAYSRRKAALYSWPWLWCLGKGRAAEGRGLQAEGCWDGGILGIEFSVSLQLTSAPSLHTGLRFHASWKLCMSKSLDLAAGLV